jgi:hypothetical protein
MKGLIEKVIWNQQSIWFKNEERKKKEWICNKLLNLDE